MQKSQIAGPEYFFGGFEPLAASGDTVRMNQVQARAG
jgi:hypothetical protein